MKKTIPELDIPLGRYAGDPGNPDLTVNIGGNIAICGTDAAGAAEAMLRIVSAVLTETSAAVYVIDPGRQLVDNPDDLTTTLNTVTNLVNRRAGHPGVHTRRRPVVVVINLCENGAVSRQTLQMVSSLADLCRDECIKVHVVCRVPALWMVDRLRPWSGFRTRVSMGLSQPHELARFFGTPAHTVAAAELEIAGAGAVHTGSDDLDVFVAAPRIEHLAAVRALATAALQSRVPNALAAGSGTTTATSGNTDGCVLRTFGRWGPYGDDVRVGDVVLVEATVVDADPGPAEEIEVQIETKVEMVRIPVLREKITGVRIPDPPTEPADGTWLSNQAGTRVWRRWDDRAPLVAGHRFTARWLDLANTVEGSPAWVTWPQAHTDGADPAQELHMRTPGAGERKTATAGTPGPGLLAALGETPAINLGGDLGTEEPVELPLTEGDILIVGDDSSGADDLLLFTAWKLGVEAGHPIAVLDWDRKLVVPGHTEPGQILPCPANSASSAVLRQVADKIRRIKTGEAAAHRMVIVANLPAFYAAAAETILGQLTEIARINRTTGVQIIYRVHTVGAAPAHPVMDFDAVVVMGVHDKKRLEHLLDRWDALTAVDERLLRQPRSGAAYIRGNAGRPGTVRVFGGSPMLFGPDRLRSELTARAAAHVWADGRLIPNEIQ